MSRLINDARVDLRAIARALGSHDDLVGALKELLARERENRDCFFDGYASAADGAHPILDDDEQAVLAEYDAVIARANAALVKAGAS